MCGAPVASPAFVGARYMACIYGPARSLAQANFKTAERDRAIKSPHQRTLNGHPTDTQQTSHLTAKLDGTVTFPPGGGRRENVGGKFWRGNIFSPREMCLTVKDYTFKFQIKPVHWESRAQFNGRFGGRLGTASGF